VASRTRLYQRAGSPLIHGRSRHERRFVSDWALGALVALIALYAIHGTATLFDPSGARIGSAAGLVRWLTPMLPAVLGMIPGAALGVWIARLLGWRLAWLAGAVVGIVIGMAVLIVWRYIG
jgi:hypothetical protein